MTTDTRETHEPIEPLGKDTLFQLLSNARRRRLIQALDRDGPLPKNQLADRLAAIETDTVPDRVSHADRKRVYVSLHQVHLPKLTDAGVVEVDETDGTELVSPGPTFGQLDEFVGDDEGLRDLFRSVVRRTLAFG